MTAASAAAVLLGLAALAFGADRFVAGAAWIARRFGVPPFLIGVTVVGFGTSAPELVVSVMAAARGDAGVALGNAYGSNIVNILVILGVAVWIRPLAVAARVVRADLPLLILATLLALFQAWDGQVTRGDALVLLAAFAVALTLQLRAGGAADGGAEPDLPGLAASPARAMLGLALGAALLLVGSRLLVVGAVAIAEGFGVSDLVIGLTVVAIGTSLPEAAASLAAARKGHGDIALGNVLGSNLFNTLAVVGVAAAVQPLPVAAPVLTRDLPVVLIATVALLALRQGRAGGELGRTAGTVLVAAYLAYTAVVVATGG